MKFFRWLQLLALALLLAACAKATVTPTLPPGTIVITGTPPQVEVTHAPDGKAAMTIFLTALQKFDFSAMYALTSQDTHKALTEDAFIAKYNAALDSMGASKLDFTVLSESGLSPSSDQIGFRIIYHTAMFGDIQRDMTARLAIEQGQWRVQWDDGLILPELAGGNSLKTDYKIPSRGDIYDRNGLPLVTQSDAFAIGITAGTMGPKAEGDVVAQLALLCNRRVESIQKALDSAGAGWYVPVCDAAASEVKQVLGSLPGGATATPYSSRFYLNQGIAPQVVGYASLIHKEDLNTYLRLGYRGDEKVGQMGIEKSMEQYLAGKHGGTLYVVDPNGQILNTLGSSQPQPADSVYLTIDSGLQQQVQRTIQSFTGAAVVLERDTGRVLAMASSPTFDPNIFDVNNFNSNAMLSQLVNDPTQPTFNRAAQGQYPLGSAFKPITMAAAMESGLYVPETTYDCQYDFTELAQAGAGPVLHDWTWEHCQNRLAAGNQCDTGDSKPSGLLTLQEGLMRSCDPYFWHIGLDLYNNNRSTDISNMARGFGLGSATGIGTIAEATGNVPDPKEPIDATNLAIGQGNLQVTPLQVARFVAAIGNGGTLYRPQLIEKVQPVNGNPIMSFKPEAAGTLPITPERLQAIQQAMEMVVKNPRGTAYYRMLGLNFPIAGKTGTAQTSQNQPDAWFIGYTEDAANSSKPDIAIAVLLENQGEGADWAAPIFRAIVESYYYGSPQANPWFGPFDNLYTPTPFGYASKTPRPKGRPTTTPHP